MVDTDLSRVVWHKSTFSNGNGGACAEVARNLPGIVAVRDSKDHGTGPALTFVKDEWSAFVAGVKGRSVRLAGLGRAQPLDDLAGRLVGG